MKFEDLRFQTKERLKGNYSQPITVMVIMLFITIVQQIFFYFIGEDLSEIISFGISIAMIPLSYGVYSYFLKFARYEEVEVGYILSGYNDFGKIVITQILVGFYTFLWSLLFIIPGIIKGLSYSMTIFLLHDYPELTATQTINLSKQMMYGHKMELFLLQLIFVIWILLSLLLLGIPLFWVYPYIYVYICNFYEDIKREYLSKNNMNDNLKNEGYKY
ncbi:MAG: hypothetical protein K0R54_519 [Clostridiaceae bacterium]|jgi:uncharacterized membrane protein|nr:hypothetical protein [Clostridiaceae bacterium]